MFERDYLSLIARDSSTTVQTPAVRSVNGGVNEPVDEYTTVGKGGKVMQFTSEGIFKHLQAVQEARGKKVYSHPDPFIAYLPDLFTFVRTPTVLSRYGSLKSLWM